LPANQERFALIRELLDEHVLSLSRVAKSRNLCRAALQQRRSDLALNKMRAGRSIEREKNPTSICFHFKILSAHVVRTPPNFPFRACFGQFWMALSHVNWWEPVTLDSEVSCTPTGPQVWPFPQQGRAAAELRRERDVAIRI